MKKFLSVLVVLLVVAIPALSAVDDVTSSGSTITTAGFTNTYVVRGQIEGILVTIPATKTATVSVVTSSGTTIYTGTALTSATDGYKPLRFPMYGSTGSALTWITSMATVAGAATNAILDRIGIAESVVIAIDPAADTTGTNTYTAKLIVNK